MVCNICFINSTGKCSKCHLRLLCSVNNSVCCTLVHCTQLPPSGQQISVQLSLLCGLRTGEVTISPVWLMPRVFLPRTAKSGKLLIIWKYQWEWRSLCRCGSVAVAFANETCSCWDRKPCSLGLGTPRWQGDNCYCKLLLAMHEERVSVPVLPPLIWS